MLHDQRRNGIIHMENATPHRTHTHARLQCIELNSQMLLLAKTVSIFAIIRLISLYLFGKIKHYLQGKELFETIVEILNGISKDELLSVMEEWERRLEAWISNDGEYVD